MLLFDHKQEGNDFIPRIPQQNVRDDVGGKLYL
jgi:hypothetical protein